MRIELRSNSRFQKIVRFFKLMGLIASIPFIFIIGILWVIIVIFPVILYDFMGSMSNKKYNLEDIKRDCP